jgi:hypothetical protein
LGTFGADIATGCCWFMGVNVNGDPTGGGTGGPVTREECTERAKATLARVTRIHWSPRCIPPKW